MVDLKDLENLSPEERLKRINEFKRRLKEEEENLNKLKKRSEEELKEEKKKKDDIPILQVTADSIDELLTEEEKEIFRNKRFIEQRIKEEAMQQNSEASKNYFSAETPVEDFYKQTTKIAYEVYNSDTYQPIDRLYEMKNAIEEKRKSIEQGAYSLSDEMNYQLNVVERILDDLIGKYKK